LKRHLFVLDAPQQIGSGWPFVWSLEQNFYFRPESGGLLLSVCDEELSKQLEPTINPDISETMVDLVWKQLPTLREASQRQLWSCFRTIAPDGSFIIGWDHQADRFFWVVGLGGHGIGEWAAQRFVERGPVQPHPFDPIRFADRLSVT
jgi:D-arginine dehydrogenase